MAFPENSVLDNFNRANAADLGSNWGVGITGSEAGSWTVFSNRARSNSGNLCGGYWNPSTYGPDSEVFLTVAAIGLASYFRVALRLASPGTSGVDGYLFDWNESNGWFVYFRVDNGTNTQLGSTIAGSFSDGDQLGLNALGTVLTGFKNGSTVENRSDGTYTSAGNIGMGIGSGSASSDHDDFGGGEATPPTPALFVTTSPLRW